MNIVTILVTLLILSALVVAHEFGHFIAARKNGVFVEEFAIGMGPKLFKRQGKETLFTLRALPIGGFCKMRGEGEQVDDEGNLLPQDPNQIPDPTSFESKTKKQKLVILAAGSAMNIVFAWVCLLLLAFIVGGNNIFEAIGLAFVNTGRFAGIIFKSLAMIFQGQVGMDDVAGPIGMVSLVDLFMAQGFRGILTFTALISVNLGVINMLPIPALDGGHIFILLIEAITRKEISPRAQGLINLIGFIAIMGLGLLIAFNDIMRLST